jgi:hypothetical protein
LAHIWWNCALKTGSRRISSLCLRANSSSEARNTASWSFMACRLAALTSSPTDLYCSCAQSGGVV